MQFKLIDRYFRGVEEKREKLEIFAYSNRIFESNILYFKILNLRIVVLLIFYSIHSIYYQIAL